MGTIALVKISLVLTCRTSLHAANHSLVLRILALQITATSRIIALLVVLNAQRLVMSSAIRYSSAEAVKASLTTITAEGVLTAPIGVSKVKIAVMIRYLYAQGSHIYV